MAATVCHTDGRVVCVPRDDGLNRGDNCAEVLDEVVIEPTTFDLVDDQHTVRSRERDSSPDLGETGCLNWQRRVDLTESRR